MDHFFDERDERLLGQDPYTFFVMKRILGADCAIKLSDHERFILCYTCAPYPVWLWTPEDVSCGDMERAYQTVREQGLLDRAHHFNMKYALAEYFIQRAARDGKPMAITVNMLAYDCPQPVEPTVRAEGAMRLCGPEDTDALVDFLDGFHRETGVDQRDREGYRQEAAERIAQGKTYFWCNAAGERVASCAYNVHGTMASVGLVYTHPQHRRKHYGENLVYAVTQIAREAGLLPMLYTDADYAASNACYQKIGYVLRGRLCTVGMQ